MAAEKLKGDSLKQRLVGGIALLVIGIVAWFWLLSADSPVDQVSRTTQIPPAPDIQSFAVAEPAAPAGVAPVGSERDSEPALRADVAADQPTALAGNAPEPVSPQKSEPAKEQPKLPKAQPEPAKAASTATNKPAANSNTAATTKPASAVAKKEAFELDQHGLPVAWVIQVGLFSTQAGADKIKAELQQKGFKAYTEPYKTAKAPAGIKVFVGPKLSRERADEQKRAIDAALRVNSIVVRFQAPQR